MTIVKRALWMPWSGPPGASRVEVATARTPPATGRATSSRKRTLLPA
jgi:hypothetical protein